MAIFVYKFSFLTGAQPHKGYIITGPGLLRQCKLILHVIGPQDPASTKKIVLDALKTCEKNQVSSITFPALGTGMMKASQTVLPCMVPYNLPMGPPFSCFAHCNSYTCALRIISAPNFIPSICKIKGLYTLLGMCRRQCTE